MERPPTVQQLTGCHATRDSAQARTSEAPDETSKQLSVAVSELAAAKDEVRAERELRQKAEKALEEAHSHEEALAQAKHQAATQLAVSGSTLVLKRVGGCPGRTCAPAICFSLAVSVEVG